MKQISYIILLLFVTACSLSPRDVLKADALPEIYPDYIGVTIPAEIAPMNFCMADETVEAVSVKVRGSNGGELESKTGLFAKKDVAHFDIEEWHSLTKENIAGELIFSVKAFKDGQWKEYEPFSMFVSSKPLVDYGITYRKIAPGFETFSDIGIYQRRLSAYEEETIFNIKDVDGQCMNCHYANRGNPEQYLVHVRGKHGATMVHNRDKDTDLNTKTNKTCGSCTYG